MPPTDSLRVEDRRKKKGLAHAALELGGKTRSRTLLEIDWRSDLSLGGIGYANKVRLTASILPVKMSAKPENTRFWNENFDVKTA